MSEPYATTTVTSSTETTTLTFNIAESLVATRQRCLKTLENIINLVKSIDTIFDQAQHEGSSNDTLRILERLDSIHTNVKDLELRMCIVAPMKAGKSTVINAILGQSILPMRNTAMTVIPTEIVLQVIQSNDTPKKPALIMDKELIEQIRSMQNEIRLDLANSYTLENLQRKLPEHSHLITIAEEIRDAIDGHPLEEECSGTEHICQTLQYVNDVIRLHEILIPTENSSTASRRPFTKLPRIVAPYIAHGDENEMHGSLGNLVIVDTPGPNENTTTNFLKEIMIRELRKATVILVILDYTVLNTEADNLVRNEILNIRQARSKDDDSLIALINKVDRRRKGDITTTEVYEFVRNKFDFGQVTSDQQTTNRIFEVQALRALLAKQFLKDINDTNQSSSLKITDLKSGSDFLAEAYGAAYDEDDPPTIDKAIKDATKLWKKSGFDVFLNGAVEQLIERAAPRAIESALNHCDSCLDQLHENLTIREKLLSADEETLRLQSEELLADLQKMDRIMKTQKATLIDEQTKIITDFRRIFTNVKANVLMQLTAALDEHFQFSSVVTKVSNIANLLPNTPATADIAAGTSAVVAVSSITPILVVNSPVHSFMWKMANVLVNRAISDGKLKFENEGEGRSFIRDIEGRIRDLSQIVSTRIQADVDERSEQACTRLNEHLRKDTEDILRTAQNRLTSTFNIQFEKPRICNPVHSVSADFELKLGKTYRPWWLLYLFEISYENGYVEGTTYQIKISDLKQHCIRRLDSHMDMIEKQLNEYLTDILSCSFDQHFNNLTEYLLRYRDYIEKSLKDQVRSRDEKIQLKASLIEFIQQINDQIKMVNEIREFFESREYSTSVDAE